MDMRIQEDIPLASENLVRFSLFKLKAESYLFLRRNHHIYSDNWSWKVWFRDLTNYYEEQTAPAQVLASHNDVSYLDFAHWQRQRLSRQSKAYQAELDWWCDKLEGNAPLKSLPFAREVPVDDAPISDGVYYWSLDHQSKRKLEQLKSKMQVSSFAFQVAAFAAVLAHATQQCDMVLGIYVTNRDRYELQQIIGFFANMVPLRLQLDGDPTMREWISVVRKAILDCQRHSEIPYEELLDALTQIFMTHSW